jgi:putative serine/threonine protein kinase
LKETCIASINDLKKEPYAAVLCYPKINEAALEARIMELEQLGIKEVEFSGRAKAFNVPVLGKGYVGVVVLASFNGKRCAMKIRRIDADRQGLQYEAQMLEKANSVNVGPKLAAVSQNFLLMEFIDGDLLPRWIEKTVGTQVLRMVLRKTIIQCARLDSISLDHGELSKAPKHVIIDSKQEPFLVDFETASLRRRPSNVTAICQYLFSSRGAVAQLISDRMGPRNIDNVIDTLRIYKHSGTQEGLQEVLNACLS